MPRSYPNRWFWWDGADKLRKVTDINDPADPTPFFTATYNGDGIRVKKNDTRGGVLQQHDFAWGPYGLLWESNPNTVYTPGFGHRSNGINSFYHVDWLGSTRYVTALDGTATAAQWYEAFGTAKAAPGRPLAAAAENHPQDPRRRRHTVE